MKKNITIGIISALICETLFGLSYLFTKKITNSVDIFSILAWRFSISCVVMSIFFLFKKDKIHFKSKNIIPLILLSFLNPILYFICENYGISLTTASESGAFIATIPIFSIIMSTIILKKKPLKMQVVGIIITLIGVLISVISIGVSASLSYLGYLMLLIAVIGYSIYATLVEKKSEYNSYEFTYMMQIVGMAVFLPIGIIKNLINNDFNYFISLPFKDIDFLICVIYQSIGSSILGFLFSNIAIAKIGVNKMSTFIGVSTVVSILAGVIFLHENFIVGQIIGAIFIIIGVYVANIKIRSKKCQNIVK